MNGYVKTWKLKKNKVGYTVFFSFSNCINKDSSLEKFKITMFRLILKKKLLKLVLFLLSLITFYNCLVTTWVQYIIFNQDYFTKKQIIILVVTTFFYFSSDYFMIISLSCIF